jgi:acyl carrier protein
MEASAMNSESIDRDKRQILDDITQAIFAVSDQIPPSQKIEMDTLLIADLGLESIEIANLLFRLNAHYSGAVSLADFVTEVAGADWQSDASVGGIVDFVAASLRPGQAAPGTVPEPGADRAAHS